MVRSRRLSPVALLFLSFLCGCSREPSIPTVAPRPADTIVTLPDGISVRAEMARTEAEREYGLMGRSTLPQDRAMLFIYPQAGRYPFWMYHCKIPLDILWLDQDSRIVEASAETPPCRGHAQSCRSYGGHKAAIYVLELPSGSIKRHQLMKGQAVAFRPSDASDHIASTN